MYLIAFLLLSFLSFAYLQTLIPKTPSNYGPYKIELTHYDLCKGVHLQISRDSRCFYEKLPNNSYVAGCNMTFDSPTQMDVLTMEVSKGDEESIILWKYKVNKPCQNLILGPLLTAYYRLDNRCLVKEGFYSIRFILGDQASMFLGDKFFYGEFIFKVTISSKKYTLICYNIKCRFVKKV